MKTLMHWMGVSALATSVAACGSIEVDRIPDGQTVPATGVLYALPITVVRTKVQVDRAEKSGAPYARFAAIFAPDSKPVCPEKECTAEEKVSFSVAKTGTLATYGEPDMSQVFLVKFTGGGAIDQSLSMTWNEAGLLSSTQSSVTNRTMDIVTSGIKMATSLGAKFAGGASDAEVRRQVACPQASSADAWALPILEKDPDVGVIRLTTSNYCNIKAEIRSKWTATPDNKALLAEALVAYDRFVKPLATARDNILDGTSSSVDQANLLTKLESNLDTNINRYFIGKSATDSWAGVLDTREITAGSTLPLTIPLFNLDAKQGICLLKGTVAPDAASIPKNFIPAVACGAASKTVSVQIDYYPPKAWQLFTKVADDPTGKRSFRYRIPAQVSATLNDGDGRTVGAAVLSVAQLGTVISLPAQRHSKGLTYELGFVEATGGLKTFKLGTAGGLDSSTIDSLSGAAGGVVDARNAAKKSEQEVSVLMQEDQLLKLRDDICTIQKKYGIACTVAP